MMSITSTMLFNINITGCLLTSRSRSGINRLGKGPMMSSDQQIDRQLDRFLKNHCPNPAVIRGAIARTKLATVTDYLPGELICRSGDRVSGCWLVLTGQIEIRADDQNVTFRGAGEMVGEQGLLH